MPSSSALLEEIFNQDLIPVARNPAFDPKDAPADIRRFDAQHLFLDAIHTSPLVLDCSRSERAAMFEMFENEIDVVARECKRLRECPVDEHIEKMHKYAKKMKRNVSDEHDEQWITTVKDSLDDMRLKVKRTLQDRHKRDRSGVFVRWMIERDIPAAEKISQATSRPLSSEAIRRKKRRSDTIGMVAETSNTIVGYTLYQLQNRYFHFLDLGVAPRMRKRGIAAKIIRYINTKLTLQGRRESTMNITEDDEDMTGFLLDNGFVVTGYTENPKDGSTERIMNYSAYDQEDAHLFDMRREQLLSV